jgi:NADH:ubiquinone oxidoreductase subunit 4 (subunit M)
MIIFGILLSVAIMAAMVYLALSKKSSFSIRLASLIALALMIIAVIVCLFMIFGNPAASVEKSAFARENPVPIQAEEDSISIALLLLIVFLLAFFVLVVILVFRERRKSLQ